MEFWDLVSDKNEHLADIIEFDDGVFVLKFNTFGKVYCFDDIFKLMRYLEKLRLSGGYKLIKNGVDEEDEDDSDEE